MRLETGVVQVDGDWPGVFIRGDNAFAYAMHLQAALGMLPKDADDISAVLAHKAMEGIIKLLASCDTVKNPTPQMIKLA